MSSVCPAHARGADPLRDTQPDSVRASSVQIPPTPSESEYPGGPPGLLQKKAALFPAVGIHRELRLVVDLMLQHEPGPPGERQFFTESLAGPCLASFVPPVSVS